MRPGRRTFRAARFRVPSLGSACLRGFGRLGSVVLSGYSRDAWLRAVGGGDHRADGGALVVGETAVGVGRELCGCESFGWARADGFEPGELAGGEDRVGGVPVGAVPGAAGLGVGVRSR